MCIHIHIYKSRYNVYLAKAMHLEKTEQLKIWNGGYGNDLGISNVMLLDMQCSLEWIV